MSRVRIPVHKDGFVLASHMVEILEPMAEAIAERCGNLEDRVDDLERENARLRSELETERRHRLAERRINKPRRLGG